MRTSYCSILGLTAFRRFLAMLKSGQVSSAHFPAMSIAAGCAMAAQALLGRDEIFRQEPVSDEI